jgi:hypothetical protein
MAPSKTAEGYAELVQRTRGLSQRHRTVLLLVDGRRSTHEVRALCSRAGVPQTCFDELVTLGLIDAGDAPTPDGADSSPLPAAESLPPDSCWDEAVPATAAAPRGVDGPLEEARDILERALRNEAPVIGSFTLFKLRRAATREALEALLDEVEQRIRKPRKMIVAAQTMRHVRHLLTLPAELENDAR